ncbi:MAG: ribonuclease HII, partial [Pseudomonadota bacterium]
MPDLSFEALHPAPVCGVDEVGRGPWAGPVLACAVILNPANIPAGLDDSKKIPKARREALAVKILSTADVGLGEASVTEVDQINILQATYLAMRRAISALQTPPAFALIDGNRTPPGLPCPSVTLVKGDSRSASIAAASIVAKVTRDKAMVALAQQFPGYGWETNAGYGVKAHAEALKRLGVTPHHRR